MSQEVSAVARRMPGPPSPAEPLALGPLLIARPLPRQAAPRGLRPPLRRDAEFLAICFPTGTRVRSAAALIADAAGPQPIHADGVVLLAPRRFLSDIWPGGAIPHHLPPSAGLRVLRHYVDGLLALDPEHLCARQAELAAQAIRAMLAATLLTERVDHGLASRRCVSLQDRIVAYVDGHVRAPMSVETLCRALACSRSALYRATAQAGGVAELVLTRRLIAARERLCDASERRSIASIAEEHCFADAAQFSRRFKGLFGTAPGEVRRSAARSSRSPSRGRIRDNAPTVTGATSCR